MPQDPYMSSVRFTTDRRYGEEPGSLKLMQKKDANGGTVLHFKNALDVAYADNKYMVMYVYYEGESEDMNLWFTKTNSEGWGWAEEDWCPNRFNLKPNTWTSVILPLKGISSLNDYGIFTAVTPKDKDWYLSKDDVLYFSNAVIREVPADVVIASEDVFGLTQLLGDWNDDRAQISHSVSKAYGNESGSIRITQLEQGKDGWGKELLVHFNNPLNESDGFTGYKDNEYLKFQIWYEGDKPVHNMKVMLSHTAGNSNKSV